MTEEIAIEKNITLSANFKKEFELAMTKHQELSRTASAGKFKGGLADSSEETTRLHTTAHLLLEALRRVLGDHVHQKGSNITAERLRFDFSHSKKMTDEQKQAVEKLVNEQIAKKLPVSFEEMTLDEAKDYAAQGMFESKYGEKVKVYTIGEKDDIFSKEICGGPHIDNIAKIGIFKIKKEKSSSAGVRRIKAILE
jgi:alanyl-tRNA synthetase